MNERGERPLLFLDVDGPLLPFGDGPQHEPSGTASHSHLARLDPRIGARLAALPCELVWATTWEEAANTDIAPRLGLPPCRSCTGRNPPTRMNARTSGSGSTGRPEP